MCSFSSAENQGEFERIAVFQEASTLIELHFDVMLAGAKTEANALNLAAFFDSLCASALASVDGTGTSRSP